MISLMVTFRTFSFLDFLADLLQKSISVDSNLFACCVFSVHNAGRIKASQTMKEFQNLLYNF
jgi:hypothetical protein